MSNMRFAAASAATGTGIGLLIMGGYAARTCFWLARNGRLRDARDFLGLLPRSSYVH